jgi:hypothetical protein
MIRYIVWVDDEGDIKIVKIAKGNNNPENGAIDAANNNWTILHKMDTIEDMNEFVEERYWSFTESAYKTRDAKPNRYGVWADSAWSWDSDLLLGDIREERNLKLFKSDWSVFTDSPLSDSQKTEATNYRTALRNLPSTVNMNTVTSIDDTPWPTAPSFLA